MFSFSVVQMHFNRGDLTSQCPRDGVSTIIFPSLILSDFPHYRYDWASCQILSLHFFRSAALGQPLLVETSMRRASGKGVSEMHSPQSTTENLKQEEGL